MGRVSETWERIAAENGPTFLPISKLWLVSFNLLVFLRDVNVKVHEELLNWIPLLFSRVVTWCWKSKSEFIFYKFSSLFGLQWGQLHNKQIQRFRKWEKYKSVILCVNSVANIICTLLTFIRLYIKVLCTVQSINLI